jgi:hypothetical protein
MFNTSSTGTATSGIIANGNLTVLTSHIDRNSFSTIGAAGNTSNNIITLRSLVGSSISHNTFDTCNASCQIRCADGISSTHISHNAIRDPRIDAISVWQ